MSRRPILCRCEDVTVHEFEQAYAEGFTDFESLKRYTGVGTGFCQGKACLSESALVLARLRGVPPSEVPLTNIRPPLEPLTFAELAALEVPAPADAPGGPGGGNGTGARGDDAPGSPGGRLRELP